MPTAPTHYLSCDWGTTHLRLRVIHSEHLGVEEEIKTHDGARIMDYRFRKMDEKAQISRMEHYGTILRYLVEEFPERYHRLPLVITGMASSTIGMVDLPYGELPITAGAEHFVVRELRLWAGNRTLLVSGIKGAEGMMRGEETQALGLLPELAGRPDGTLLLPGTHSKHLRYAQKAFVDFATYMTGEVFDVLTQHSILARSVEAGPFGKAEEAAFRDGLESYHQGSTAGQLFRIRADDVLRGVAPNEAYYRLSGLLIAEELSDLADSPVRHIYLAGAGPLLHLYRIALETLLDNRTLTVFDAATFQRALFAGQRQLLTKYLQT